ncbi:glycosyltransferase 61 family protein [Pirellulales bacterium]|nr:glycosyltransferase 61 family protein [Pirellulales bacterium]
MRSYQPPANLWSIGKYLIPSDFWRPRNGRVEAPSDHVSIRALAEEHPQQVSLTEVGAVEAQRRFDFRCYTDGVEEMDCVLARTAPAAYVARIERGRSFGRQCSVIAPNNQVVRESGFFMDPKEMDAKALLGRHGLRHWRYRLQVDLTSWRRLPPAQTLAGSVAALNMRYSHSHYSWLTEILPRLSTLRRVGITCDHYLVDCRTPMQRAVLTALGISQEQCIQPHCQLLLEPDQLIVPSLPTPECLRQFGAWASECLGVAASEQQSRRIYLSRRHPSSSKRLANEAEFQELLVARGFEKHYFEDYDVATQARLMRHAEAVVATHGAGLANLIFAQPGTRVIEVIPDGRYNPTCHPELSRTFSLSHQIVFARCPPHKQTLRVALDDAEAALSRALRPRRRRAA